MSKSTAFVSAGPRRKYVFPLVTFPAQRVSFPEI
jgi:hypothetical protein